MQVADFFKVRVQVADLLVKLDISSLIKEVRDSGRELLVESILSKTEQGLIEFVNDKHTDFSDKMTSRNAGTVSSRRVSSKSPIWSPTFFLFTTCQDQVYNKGDLMEYRLNQIEVTVSTITTIGIPYIYKQSWCIAV